MERHETQRPSRAEAALNSPAPTLLLIGVFAIALGIVIVLGGKDAWAGFDYGVALKVPGAPQSWGWALLLGGLFTVGGKVYAVRNRIPLLVGLFGCGFWHLFFGVSFTVEYVNSGVAGLSLAVTHMFLAIMYLYKFAVYRKLALHLM